MNDAALELVDLQRSFVQGDVTIDVLRGVNASLRRGEIVALLGPSGSGKSTMLQAVGLLEGGFGGTIRVDGEDVTRFQQGERTRTRREKIGFVFTVSKRLSSLAGPVRNARDRFPSRWSCQRRSPKP